MAARFGYRRNSSIESHSTKQESPCYPSVEFPGGVDVSINVAAGVCSYFRAGRGGGFGWILLCDGIGAGVEVGKFLSTDFRESGSLHRAVLAGDERTGLDVRHGRSLRRAACCLLRIQRGGGEGSR